MRLKDYLAAKRGRCTRMAVYLNVSRGFVSMMANQKKPVPIKTAIGIERFTKGAVGRKDLVSNWNEIWPELRELKDGYDDN